MAWKYQAYARYNQPDAKWLGQIPEHWDAMRCKYIYKEFGERSEDGLETLLSVSEYYGIKPRSSVMEEGDFLSRAESLEGYKKCQFNDLVMNIMLAWKTGLGVTKHDGIVSPAYSVFRLISPCCPDYMNYLLRTPLYTTEFKTKSTGVIDSRLRLYPESFGTIEIIKPPLEEQEQIADFLDHETAKIDTLIDKQQQLIKLLKEKRQAVISHAVTKGLSPDAVMKDSGVEWLGEVPEHWANKSLRHIGRCQNGINIGAEYFGSGFPFVSYGDVYKNKFLPLEVDGLVQSSDEDRKVYSVEKGDVFFTRTSETIDEIGFSSVCLESIKTASFAGFLIRFRPYAKILNENYSKYYFQNVLLRAFFVKEMNLVTRASLSQDLLKKMAVLIPDIREQREIAEFLDVKTAKIDRLIKLSNRAIALMQERRTALISAAVTGKIDVRNWQPAQPETPREASA